SNAERAVLELGAAEPSELPDGNAAKRALYRLGSSDFVRHVLLAGAASCAGPEDKAWRAALALPERWKAPAFPLRGADIMALGGLRGPEVGEMLRRLQAGCVGAGVS